MKFHSFPVTGERKWLRYEELLAAQIREMCAYIARLAVFDCRKKIAAGKVTASKNQRARKNPGANSKLKNPRGKIIPPKIRAHQKIPGKKET